MGIEIVNFKKYEKNSLRGFLTVRLDQIGLEIRDIALHQRNGSRWLQLPAKPYKKPDGSQGWNYIVSFYEKPRFQQFQEVALKALDAFQCQEKRNQDHEKVF